MVCNFLIILLSNIIQLKSSMCERACARMCMYDKHIHTQKRGRRVISYSLMQSGSDPDHSPLASQVLFSDPHNKNSLSQLW